MSTKTLEKAADDLNSAHGIKETTIPAAATLARGLAKKDGTTLDADATNPFANLTTAQKRAILADLMAVGLLDSVNGSYYSLGMIGGNLTPTELAS